VLEHARRNVLLVECEPFERTDNALRFKVSLPAKGTASQTVRVERIYGETFALSDTDLNAIQYYLSSLGGSAMSPAVKQALEKVVALRTELDRLGRERGAREQVLKESAEEQDRIRKNLQVLNQKTDSYTRQLTKLDKLETQIEDVREQVAKLRDEEAKQRTALETYLSTLTVDGK
jgi:septal ring factor EnvC (AmiA/AmiB activator)